ncbi:VWA domain-containing protein [Actinokineospora enzanensis]|uniref:VWA domain-containing protein n=1 Tax=Actinokineospora enzanensis TaxID=155975 RepID=UPI00037E740C|nr:VWA domain-containing protein [Actinokineospora enzanensis]
MVVGRRRALYVFLPTLVLGVALAVVAYLVVRPDPSASGPHGPCVRLEVSSSTEKDELVAAMADTYNHAGRVFGDGRCAEVSAHGLTSGLALDALEHGWQNQKDPRPQVWLPSTSLWLDRMVAHGQGDALAGPDHPSITIGALVVAMPDPMADAVLARWPRPTWADLLTLVDRDGWDAVAPGRGWGPFVLVRDNPERSSSGLAATVATYQAAAAQAGVPLDDAALDNPAVATFVHRVESSVVRRSDDATVFLQQVYEEDKRRPAVPPISAIVMQEQLAYLYNRGVPSGDTLQIGAPGHEEPNTRLTAITPTDGTILLDHPYAVMASAAPEQRLAAEDFRRFLLDEDQQKRFREAGFRDVAHPQTPTPELVEFTRSDPRQRVESQPLPPGPVVDKMLRKFTEVRKPARVLLLIDTSGSMADPESRLTDTPKIDKLRDAALAAVDTLGGRDEVGLWTFATGHRVLVPADGTLTAPYGQVAGQVKAAIDGLREPEGQTDLYATLAEAQRLMFDSRSTDKVSSIVLMTDGENYPDKETAAKDALLHQVDASLNDGRSIRIFTIPYGETADLDTLQQIADRSKGECFDAKTRIAAEPDLIRQLFVKAFSNI